MIVMQIADLVFSHYLLKHPPVLTMDRAALIQRVGAAIQHQLQ